MPLLLPLVAAAALYASAGDPEVSVASGDWGNIPAIAQVGDLQISDQFANQLISAVAANNCASAGTPKHVNVAVPFLVQFTPQGQLERVVVHRIDCPAVEMIVGSVVLNMAKAGNYRPTGKNIEGWYLGRFEFESRQ
jgi:hypothetical protein